MTKFALEYEWESAGGSRGSELSATWARFGIKIDDQWVTRVDDFTSKSVRNAVYGPLYPIAEWIATNWWPLLFEVASPHKLASRAYERTHNLKYAAEGFALPSLSFYPEGQQVIAKWEGSSHPGKQVAFIGSHRTALDSGEFENTLRTFLTSVITRLEDQDIEGTLLQEEWKAIDEADPEERAFCQVLGHLGADPYAPASEEADAYVMQLAHRLPGALLEEFSSTTNLDHIQAEGTLLEGLVANGASVELDLHPLNDLRGKLDGALQRRQRIGEMPWQQGYDTARALRKILATEQNIANTDSLAGVLSVNPAAWHAALPQWPLPNRYINAALIPTRSGAPCVTLRRSNEANRVFALCRALFEFLESPAPETPALVTTTSSSRQKRNRAFAAEFLAPAATIRDLIHAAPLVSSEEVQDLADQFGTSEFVIRHQLANHKIASIQEMAEF